MENQFVPYELAVKLKELGFDEECFGAYRYYFNGYREYLSLDIDNTVIIKNRLCNGKPKYYILSVYSVTAPLWQQAFDWFLKEHRLFSRIYIYEKSIDNKIVFDFGIKQIGKIFGLTEIGHKPLDFETYEEARQACLEKLIELITNK